MACITFKYTFQAKDVVMSQAPVTLVAQNDVRYVIIVAGYSFQLKSCQHGFEPPQGRNFLNKFLSLIIG